MPADGNRISEAAQERADDGNHALKGMGLAEDSTNLLNQVTSGEWTQGLASLVSAGFEIKDFLQDPLAKLISMGFGWVIEFVEPLNSWLDGLVGDDERLALAVENWTGISTELAEVAQDLDTAYRADTVNWSGPAVEQYKLFCADRVELYKAASNTAAATAGTIGQCKSIVAMVREIVRNLVTDAIGKIISIVCRYPLPATPAASGEVTVTVVQYTNKIAEWVKKLQTAFANAAGLLKKSGKLYRDVRWNMNVAKDSAVQSAMRGRISDAGWLEPAIKGTLPHVVDGVKAAGKEIPVGTLEDILTGGAKASAEIVDDDQ